VPAPPPLLAELGEFRRRLAALSGPLFPSVRFPAEPMRPEILSQWLVAAERAAQVPKLAGGLWHPSGRKFASERMHHPIKAVAEAGGWRDPGTLLTCYQHADDETRLAVLSEPRKRHGQLAVGAS
jgi:integrase